MSTAQSLDDLVTFEQGQLPIVLSAPHGGRLAIPGVSPRRGKGVASFVDRSDVNTDHLTEQLADAIEHKSGKRPFVVIARFHRKYADANRSRRLAYESESAHSTYEAYHQALSEARSEVVDRFGHGLLIDIHRQACRPNAIYRGT